MVLVLEEAGGGGCTVGVTGGVQEEYRKGTEGCRRGKEGDIWGTGGLEVGYRKGTGSRTIKYLATSLLCEKNDCRVLRTQILFIVGF